MVRVDDVRQHAKVLLLDMSDGAARLRSNVMLPPQAGLSFRWVGPSRDPVLVHGHVADMRMVDKKTAEYDIQFNMPEITRERLAGELLEVQRRKLFRAAEAMPPFLEDFDFARLTDRKTFRVVTQFHVTVQARKQGHWIPFKGEARDLSAGGMMLQLPDDLDKGTELELSFTLPSHGDPHNHKAAQTKEVIEITPFGERRVRKPATSKSYEQIQARAVIVKKMGNSRSGQPLFGVNFVGMAAPLREEIARWIHTQQLNQLRATSKKNGHNKHRSHSNGVSLAKAKTVGPNGTHRTYSVAQRTIQLRESFKPEIASAPAQTPVYVPRKHVPSTMWLPPKKAALARLAGEDEDVFGLTAPNPEPVGQQESNNVVDINSSAPVVDELDVFGLGVRRAEAS